MSFDSTEIEPKEGGEVTGLVGFMGANKQGITDMAN